MFASTVCFGAPTLDLDVISYESFMQENDHPILEKALNEKGIVGIRGLPGYKEKVLRFIDAAKVFFAPLEIKADECRFNEVDRSQ